VKLTSEVQAALDAIMAEREPPAESPVPAGMVNYFIAVSDTRVNGVASPATVAAVLRDLANQIEGATNG
jgi:hypothetical protein